jgi:hypothetical protein
MNESSKNDIIKFSYGNPLGNFAYVVAGILMFFSTVMFITDSDIISKILAILIFGNGIFILSLQNGILVDRISKKYCEYNIFKKKGWNDLMYYSDLVMLSQTYSQGLSYKGGFSGTVNKSTKEVYLMDPNHRKKIYIETIPKDVNPHERLEELSRILNVTVRKYNPNYGR